MINKLICLCVVYLWSRCSFVSSDSSGQAYTMISRAQTECEIEALAIGTALADNYNGLDEDTEWDTRIHNDFLVEHLGFAGWIQSGLWKTNGATPHRNHAPTLHKKGGWAGHKNISQSSYWALENKWVYMMGDSTKRQIWAVFVSPFQANDFERNAKEWTRENCARQFPHRKEHPAGGHFPEEGWGGKCGNNEVTCDMAGYGPNGKITFDWKHFPWEDYDQWLFGDTGKWSADAERIPDILTFQVGLHTCFHAYNAENRPMNDTMVANHERDLPALMAGIRKAVDRKRGNSTTQTTVIMMTGGRTGNPDHRIDECSWKFNRVAAREAHKQGFAVFEREEIERRMLFKSEHWPDFRTLKPMLHLENPAPNIVATALLGLMSCLARNGTGDVPPGIQPFHVFRKHHNEHHQKHGGLRGEGGGNN